MYVTEIQSIYHLVVETDRVYRDVTTSIRHLETRLKKSELTGITYASQKMTACQFEAACFIS